MWFTFASFLGRGDSFFMVAREGGFSNLSTFSLTHWLLSPAGSSVSWCQSCFICSGHTYEIYSGWGPSIYVYWLNWLGEFVEVYHVMLFLPKNCSVFWKRQPWASLADVTLFVGVHKYLLNFWFKRVEDCYIRVSQIVKIKSGILLNFV